MTPIVRSIRNTLSLRRPQEDALVILDDLAAVLLEREGSSGSGRTLEDKRAFVAERYPSINEFERDFPNLCFALATGVGKTRLMGAAMAYLHRAHGIRHFMILAPNLTIYEKLKRDLSPESPKYVFRGISEFAVRQPLVITGDDYQGRNFDFDDLANPIIINLFNIAKITGEMRGGNVPRIRRFAEYLGQSYFDYLAGLDDLVVLMDEAHRYRASAGMQAISDLKPRLGIELTATPRRGTAAFRNVVYAYPLGAAMKDGLVKEPTAVTRQNFRTTSGDDDGLDRIKLEDGITVHEETKIALEIYGRDRGETPVKPFMLVVAKDTNHARTLRTLIESDAFFDGRYRDRVIEVHSSLKADEEARMIERLLQVENPKEPTEIVIHVNQLNEGWDVTNLYTIVPLRAAASQILTEQTIGRGLRLPFGRRTGDPTLDALNIIAHDRFDEIIAKANDPNSLIRAQRVIGATEVAMPKETVTIRPGYVPSAQAEADVESSLPWTEKLEPSLRYESEEERTVATIVADLFEELPYVARAEELLRSDIQARLVREAKVRYDGDQPTLETTVRELDLVRFVERQTRRLVERFIVIPEIIVVPQGESTSGYSKFDLDTSGFTQRPVGDDVLLHALGTGEQRTLTGRREIADERFIENYVVRHLVDFSDVSYDRDHALLFHLVGQLVEKLRGDLPDERDVLNVVQHYQKRYAELVHLQMKPHFWKRVGSYQVKVGKRFPKLLPVNYGQVAGAKPVSYKQTPKDLVELRRTLFNDFIRAVYPLVKFESLPELRFARILERDQQDLIWLRPAAQQFRIYTEDESGYRPDFVVQTDSEIYLIEVKARQELDDSKVQAKAAAAQTWCQRASEIAREQGTRPWIYVLITAEEIAASATLAALVASYRYQP